MYSIVLSTTYSLIYLIFIITTYVELVGTYIYIHVDVDYASTALDLARSGSSFADFV